MTPLDPVDKHLMEQRHKNSPSTNGTKLEKNGDANPQSPSSRIPQSQGSKTSTNKTTNKPHPYYEYDQRYSSLPKQDKDQAVVQTPYGPGLVIRTRLHPTSLQVVSRDIELTDWAKATTAATRKGKPPKPAMLYTPTNFPSVKPHVGDDVLCGAFGRGRVLSIVPETNQAKVQLSSWRLAGRSRVLCTMQLQSLQVLRPKLVYEMNVFEKVEHAHGLKREAKALFAAKEYERALTKYALAVDAVRYVQHDGQSTNYVRADLLLIMMTCCNNAATCAAQQPSSSLSQNKWDLVTKYAKNALVLIEALEDRQKQSQAAGAASPPPKPSRVYQILLEEPGMTAAKLFAEWKGKSLLLLARAYAEKHQYDQALEACQTAHNCVTQYTTTAETSNNKILQQHEKEIQRIRTNCQHRKKMELKKEKQRAQAMFGGGSTSKKSPPAKTGTRHSEARNDPKMTKSTTTTTTTTTTAPPPARRLDSMDSSSKRNLSVTFEDGGTPRDEYIKPSSRTVSLSDDDDDDGHDYDTNDNGIPWYQEHQELLILTTGVAVIGLGAAQLLRMATTSRR